MTKKKIQIRASTSTDVDAIVDLVREHAAGAGETSPVCAAYIANYLQSPQNRILLAEMNKRILGLLSYSIRPDLYHAADSCLIEELIVEKSAREQGIAGALMEELIRLLDKKTCVELSVSVMADNASAIRFYKSHGLVDESLYLERHL
ncbi:MAG: GNAT family N-acetyltransferase [Desulfobacteraceae bacterium]|nr:MAG: GNAT family N-acetyltransferase [Desulfobacteraceae bacterium]